MCLKAFFSRARPIISLHCTFPQEVPLPARTYMAFTVMEVQSCLKASLLAMILLPVATWLPHMCSCLRSFLLVSLPSAAASPRCIFVFSNIIVVFLVISESWLSRYSAGADADADELAATGCGRPASQGHEGGQVREEEVLVVPMDALARAPIITGEGPQQGYGCDVLVVEEDENDELEASGEVARMAHGEDQQVVEAAGDAAGMTQEEEEEEEVGGGLGREGEGERNEEEDNVEERGLPPVDELREEELGRAEGADEEEVIEEEEEKMELPTDELNKKVEDFIARFNMERQLEARMLVCCC